jgi:hypothetical protein
MPVGTWGEELEMQAVEIAEAVLRGVGDTTRKSIERAPERAAIHYRREMLPQEVALLPRLGIGAGYRNPPGSNVENSRPEGSR